MGQNNNQASGNMMEKRRALFQAIEAGDDASVQKYVSDDAVYNGLRNFGAALVRYSAEEVTSAAIVEKLLSQPGLDKNSFEYERAVTGAFYSLAMQPAVPTDEQMVIADLLFECFKDDQDIKDMSLRAVFQAVVMHGPNSPNAKLAEKLAENGANVEAIFDHYNNDLLAQKRVIDKQLSDLLSFKVRVTPFKG